MAYGITIEGAHGRVQIDQNYRNLMLQLTGTATTINTPVAPYTVAGSYKQLSFSGCTTPLMFVRSNTPGEFFSVIQYNRFASDSWTFIIWSNQPTGADFDYYLFDVPSPVAGGYGLRVFNGSSNIVYDSSEPPLRIAGVVTRNDNIDLYGGYTNFPTGKTYATCPARTNVFRDSGANMRYWATSINDGTGRIEYDYLFGGTTGNAIDQTWPALNEILFFVADVTDF